MHRRHDSVNPHPAPDCAKLTQLDGRILHDLIVLHRIGAVPVTRLHLAGVPPLEDLERERQRRQSAQREVA